jgi:hypothetical protein
MNNTSMNLERTSEITPIHAPAIGGAKRFQVIVEYAAGVCVPGAVAESPEDAVEAFMVQTPGCKEGEIALFDRDEQRVVASVKWKMSGTEIGLDVPHRQNVFHDWHLALIALEVQKRREVAAAVELSA